MIVLPDASENSAPAHAPAVREKGAVREEVRRIIERAMRGVGTLEFHARFGAEDAADAVMALIDDLEVNLAVPALR